MTAATKARLKARSPFCLTVRGIQGDENELRLAWLSRPATGRGRRSGPRASRPVRDPRLPGALGRRNAAYASEDVVYRAELDGEKVVHTLTRAQPPGWTGYARRVDADLLREVAWPAEDGPLAFVCGPTSFVESVAVGLVDLGYAPARIKTERFGATGGR